MNMNRPRVGSLCVHCLHAQAYHQDGRCTVGACRCDEYEEVGQPRNANEIERRRVRLDRAAVRARMGKDKR